MMMGDCCGLAQTNLDRAPAGHGAQPQEASAFAYTLRRRMDDGPPARQQARWTGLSCSHTMTTIACPPAFRHAAARRAAA
jgi:hypothetical protein